jgi:hypothetical protein
MSDGSYFLFDIEIRYFKTVSDSEREVLSFTCSLTR